MTEFKQPAFIPYVIPETEISKDQINVSKVSNTKLSIDASHLRINDSFIKSLSPKISPSRKPKFYQWLFLTEERKQEIENDINQENEVKEKLEKSFEITVEDSLPKEVVGEKAVHNYYRHFKSLSKVQDQNNLIYPSLNYNPVKDSAYTALLSQSEKSLILPSKVGLIKKNGDPRQIQIKNFKFGDKYTKVISEGLKCLPNIQIFSMGGNRITDKGAETLLSQIGKNAKVIDLSSNNVGKLGCEHLCTNLSSRECRIEALNLEDNKLGDNITQNLLIALQNNVSLKRLNLSKNFLSDKIADIVESFLKKNSYILELYLHWNLFKTPGGIKIFKGILENESLMVLDFSWNSLGNGQTSIVPEILEVFKVNEKLLHLDLSNNNFTLDESKKIAAGLNDNHSIYGVHFVGNYGYVDSRGFLIVEDNTEKDLSEMHVSHRIDGVALIKESRKKKMDETLKDCCWICEGWNECTFNWIPGVSGGIEENIEPFFIHFDFEQYKGNYIGTKQKNNAYAYKRMVPAGPMPFFFTASKNPIISKGYEKIEVIDPALKNIRMQKKCFDFDVPERNFLNLSRKADVIGNGYVATITTLPRTPDPPYFAPRKKKEKRVWSFPMSIFKEWRKDDEELLKKCFEFDWDCSNIPRVIKKEDEIAKVKEILRGIYRQYKETYKYYAGSGPIGDTWAISQLAFNDFVNELNLVDNKTLKTSDVDIKFVATSSSSEFKSSARNPERGLIRYQLMEAMVRLADEKFIKNQGIATFGEAVTLLLENHCKDVFVKYNAQTFRDEKYWCEDTDDVMKRHKSILEQVYAKYSNKKVRPGDKKFMCLEELIDLCKHANLFDENFVERDACLAFNWAMMTQMDEINSERIFKMSFVEFLEAVGRIAHKLSPLKIGATPDPSVWPYEKRFQQPLAQKIEAILMILLQNCCSPLFKQNYNIPKVSMFEKEKEEEFEEEDDEY